MLHKPEIRWKVSDLKGNEVYLTQERWDHIIEQVNHPEMIDFEKHLKETIEKGTRKQDSLNPNKYRYTLAFDDLSGFNTHLVAMVLFRFGVTDDGKLLSNNYVVTAYQKEIG